MSDYLTPRQFGKTGINVTPLGLSATYMPGKKAIYLARNEGINLFFAFGLDFQMIHVLRDIMKSERDNIVLATGAYNYIWSAQNVLKTCEKRLKQFRTDYIDVFLLLGVLKPAEFTPRVHEGLLQLKKEGKVRAIGLSCHDRKFLGQLAQQGIIDVLMMRYNAAHRGSENDIFPCLDTHNPAVLCYTATCWTSLLRRPKGWQKDSRIPTAGDCYRFVLSSPKVHAVLTAPRNLQQLKENIAALRQGPLPEDDLNFMREFGDIVYKQKKWFM